MLSGVEVENRVEDLTSTGASSPAFDVDTPAIVAAVMRVRNTRAQEAATCNRGCCSAARERGGAEEHEEDYGWD